MKKIIILIPVYNDWVSLSKLLIEINKNIKDLNQFLFECIVINDSSTISMSKISKPSNFKTLKIINMNLNRGHARCNATGLRHINENENFDYVILMDGDGEDRPEEIQDLIKTILKDPDTSVVAKRIKRSEGFIFQSLYKIHKLITLIFTGKKINFGNYSCLLKKDVNILSNKSNLWNSFSGSVKKYIPKLNEIESTRGIRYFGPSKMSLINLIIHSFSIISVFKTQVFIRSILFIFLFIFFDFYLKFLSSIAIFLIFFFNLLIILVSFRANENDLKKSQKFIKSIELITH